MIDKTKFCQICKCPLSHFYAKNICPICSSISIWESTKNMLIPAKNVNGRIGCTLPAPSIKIDLKSKPTIKHSPNEVVYSNTRINKHGTKYNYLYIKVSGEDQSS